MKQIVLDLFGVTWDELKYSDIEKYFSVPRQEEDYLEVKSRFDSEERAIEGLVRSVVAFLNTEGGVIIYGGPRKKKRLKGEKDSEDLETTLSHTHEPFDEANMISKIVGRIEPYPIGIRGKAISDRGNRVFLISIDRNETRPYMIKGDGYYYRLDKKNAKAPHHYVEALMKMVSFPQITCVVECRNPNYKGPSAHFAIYEIAFFLRFINTSRFQNEEEFNYNFYQGSHPFIRAYPNDHELEKKIFGAGDTWLKKINLKISMSAMAYNGYLPLLITWGGRKSPIKCTMCHLTFDNFPTRNPTFTVDISNELLSNLGESEFKKFEDIKDQRVNFG